jgi:FMN reductase
VGRSTANTTPLEIAAVYGAATPPGKLALALGTAADFLAGEASVSVRRVDLHEQALGVAGTRALEDQDEATREVVLTIERADGVLFASPVYRGSFPGVLKNLLDLLPLEALRGKPVALVVVGATSHHYLGVDRHLRDVLAWFGALALPVSVYLTNEDFPDGLGETAKAELRELAAGLVQLARAVRGGLAGPPPLAARHG